MEDVFTNFNGKEFDETKIKRYLDSLIFSGISINEKSDQVLKILKFIHNE